tara:strand:+ start:376 stop:582 length:207 start_codon:yes stop_codon:yes gene_type:complete
MIIQFEVMKKNILEKIQNITADIAIKNKEIQVELDSLKKSRLQRELEVLNLRKKVLDLTDRIDNLRSM